MKYLQKPSIHKAQLKNCNKLRSQSQLKSSFTMMYKMIDKMQPQNQSQLHLIVSSRTFKSIIKFNLLSKILDVLTVIYNTL